MLYTTLLGLSPPSTWASRPLVCISPATTSLHVDSQRAWLFSQSLSSALRALICTLGHTWDPTVCVGSGRARGSDGSTVSYSFCPREHSARAGSWVLGSTGWCCLCRRMVSDAVLAVCPCYAAQQHLPSLSKPLQKGMTRGFPRTASCQQKGTAVRGGCWRQRC